MARYVAISLVVIAPVGPVLAGVSIDAEAGRSLGMRFDIKDAREVRNEDGSWAGLKAPDFLSVFDESLGLAIPTAPYLVAIPVGGDVRVEISDPVYYDVPDFDPARIAGGARLLDRIQRAPAEITSRGYLRNQRVACLSVSPLVYDRASQSLKVYTGFGVRLEFSGDPQGGAAAGTARSDEGTYESTYRAAIVNYDQGKAWRRNWSPAAAAGDYFSSSPNWVKINVESTGVYCITGADLAAAGAMTGSPSSQSLRLYSGGGLPLDEGIVNASPAWMRQVPIRVSDGGDGAFGSGDSIIFYGLGPHDWSNLYDKRFGMSAYTKNFYSDINCYWLTWGGAFQEAPRRMAKVDLPTCDGCEPYVPESFQERLHVEQDNLSDFSIMADDGWFWRPLRTGGSFAVFADTPAPDVTRPAGVKVRVGDWHRTGECGDVYFRLILRVGGLTLLDSTWSPGYASGLVYDFPASFTPSSSDLQRIDIVTPSSLPPPHSGSSPCDRLFFSWYEITYWRRFVAAANRIFFFSPDTTETTVYQIGGFNSPSLYAFDVTDQFEVKELLGADVSGGPAYSVAVTDTTRKGSPRRYAVVSSSGMLKPTGLAQAELSNIRYSAGAAYCVITHDDLVGPAETIADFHDGEVVTVREIYDEFGWGVPDATAIRDFLRWRLTSGSPIERVLLLGDATWDHKGYLNYSGFPNYVPTYERRFLPPVGNPYSTDDWFVYLVPDDGDSRVYWPTIPISRMPASSADEADLMVSKSIDYITEPSLGPWQNRIMLVADDDRIGTSCATAENDLHTIYAEQLSTKGYPKTFDQVKVYLTEYPVESTGLKTRAKADFVRNLNDGVLIANYVGHGDQGRLAQEEVFNPAAVDLVHTGPRLALFIAASCNVSRFDEPAASSMAEELLRRAEGGTIGSLASTHLAMPYPNQVLNMSLVKALFSPSGKKYPVLPLADAVQIAKATTVAQQVYFYTNDEMYTLFGDPALRLASPQLDVVPAQAQPDTLRRKGSYRFSATVMSEGEPVDQFNGSAEMWLREAADTSGYRTCRGSFLDYYILGGEIYRGRMDATDGDCQFDVFVSVDARQGARASLRCFVSDGEVSGSGLLDSLVISGDSASTDDSGPVITLVSDGKNLASGDTVAVGQRIRVDLVDDSGAAIKGKSEFIAAVTLSIDGGERLDMADSVYSIDGDFTQSRVWFDVPSLAVGRHTFTITAFDNVSNLSTRVDTLLVEAEVATETGIAYAYPNPADGSTYIICEFNRLVAADVSIYTLAGRQIWKYSSSETSAYHQIPWNGADIKNDQVANGTYLVRVEARDPADPAFSFTKTFALALIR